MPEIPTPRLRLVQLPLPHAEAIVNGSTPPGVNWAPGYPADATLVSASIMLKAREEGRELGPWTSYQVVRRGDDRVVGSMGFLAPPDADGHVQVGWWAAPDTADRNYLEEAIEAISEFAREQPGVSSVEVLPY